MKTTTISHGGTEAQSQPDVHKLKWRLAQQSGSDIWLLKQAPGWKVVLRSRSLAEVASKLRIRGVSYDDVAVPRAGAWITLTRYLIIEKEAARG